MPETDGINADDREPDKHPLLVVSWWLWLGVAIVCGLLWTPAPWLTFLAAMYVIGLLLVRPIEASARESRKMLAEGMRSKPGPFADTSQRPFGDRLQSFTGDVNAGSSPAPSMSEPRPAPMRFYLGVIPRLHYQPKSGAYIRELLERIRKNLRGTA